MFNKKTETKKTVVLQKTTRTLESTVSSSRTQRSSFRSSSLSNTAVPNINASASSAYNTYQPAYNQTRSTNTAGSFLRNTPRYSSLQGSAAGNLFYSFGVSKDNKTSLPSRNSNPAASFTRPTLNTEQEPTTSTNQTWRTLPRVERPSNAVQYSIYQDSKPPGATTAGTSSKLSNTSNVPRYDLKNEGYVLIFHHLFKQDTTGLYRKGSEQDLKLIKKVFKNYRVKVADICEDYSVRQVKKKMSEIRSKNFSNYSCLIIIIMSHGGSKEFIRAKDEMYNIESEIVDPVLMNVCLKDKPKLFFFQACKGDATMEPDYHPKATNKFDILKCYSTYEGTVSLRNIVTGTFFIQTLFKLFEDNTDMEIIDIMRLIRNHFTSERIHQAPTETSTLKKHFYFSDLRKQ